jgi:hypothetical protein
MFAARRVKPPANPTQALKDMTHVVAVDVSTGAITDLTPGEKVRSQILDDLPDQPDEILVQHNRRDPSAFDVYRIDLRTGKETLVAKNPGDVVGWQTDHEGRVRIAVRSAGLDTIVTYRPDEASEFKAIIRTDYRTEVEPLFTLHEPRRAHDPRLPHAAPGA